MSVDWDIFLSDIDFDETEYEAVLRVLHRGWLTMGTETSSFEKEFAGLLDCRHAVAVSSGTAALHLSLLALDIRNNDEVIQPAVNFIASANMTLAVGAKPVFADIKALDSPTVDPDCVRSLITPGTRAVIAMHYGGYPADIAELKEICSNNGIALIEDACHGVGAVVDGSALGTWGEAGTFSFFSNKNMVTGEGGMITTNDDRLAEDVRRLRSHGMTSLTWDRHKGHSYSYDVVQHGFNYRLDEIRAALGRIQLGKLAEFNSRRRRLMRSYREMFTPLNERGWRLTFSDVPLESQVTSCHICTALAPSSDVRSRAQATLREQRIQSSLHYPFIPDFTAFQGYSNAGSADLQKSREFCQRVITLPLFPTMTEDMIARVVESLLLVD